MYKYFPGCQSNKLYELVTGVKVRAILPDRGAVSGTLRINWTTKYMMMACGVTMGVGLLVQVDLGAMNTFTLSWPETNCVCSIRPCRTLTKVP